MSARFHPIGEPGLPWTDDDKARWQQGQMQRRSYSDVSDRIRAIAAAGRFDVVEYGRVGLHRLLALQKFALSQYGLSHLKRYHWLELYSALL